MFGVSFSELGLIFVVALVVLGPARLPGLVRKVGRWIGKARSMARDFQQQLENEINLDELNRLTDIRAKEAREEEAPVTPPQEPGDAPAGPPATEADTGSDSDPNRLASSGYPYGAQDTATPSPQPGDDTYSHAHAAGESPAPDEPTDQINEEKKDSGAA